MMISCGQTVSNTFALASFSRRVAVSTRKGAICAAERGAFDAMLPTKVRQQGLSADLLSLPEVRELLL